MEDVRARRLSPAQRRARKSAEVRFPRRRSRCERGGNPRPDCQRRNQLAPASEAWAESVTEVRKSAKRPSPASPLHRLTRPNGLCGRTISGAAPGRFSCSSKNGVSGVDHAASAAAIRQRLGPARDSVARAEKISRCVPSSCSGTEETWPPRRASGTVRRTSEIKLARKRKVDVVHNEALRRETSRRRTPGPRRCGVVRGGSGDSSATRATPGMGMPLPLSNGRRVSSRSDPARMRSRAVQVAHHSHAPAIVPTQR
jgi:hypothetical protein